MRNSMHRHTRRNTSLRLPHDHRVHAGYVAVGRIVKALVRQAHGFIEKGFVVHGGSVTALRRGVHSYFPVGFDAKNFAIFRTGNYRKFS